ncbi:Hypothetical predicted protein, partial [Paramuricea clavata]
EMAAKFTGKIPTEEVESESAKNSSWADEVEAADKNMYEWQVVGGARPKTIKPKKPTKTEEDLVEIRRNEAAADDPGTILTATKADEPKKRTDAPGSKRRKWSYAEAAAINEVAVVRADTNSVNEDDYSTWVELHVEKYALRKPWPKFREMTFASDSVVLQLKDMKELDLLKTELPEGWKVLSDKELQDRKFPTFLSGYVRGKMNVTGMLKGESKFPGLIARLVLEAGDELKIQGDIKYSRLIPTEKGGIIWIKANNTGLENLKNLKDPYTLPLESFGSVRFTPHKR